MLIPIQLHLTRKEINRMVEAENLDILYGLIGAVSYTHLDVYKRQVLVIPCISIAYIGTSLCERKGVACGKQHLSQPVI